VSPTVGWRTAAARGRKPEATPIAGQSLTADSSGTPSFTSSSNGSMPPSVAVRQKWNR
jgi:hypothetical protein